MTSKSKAKGSSYERDVAKFLSDLYGEPFMRNISGSGAFVGGVNTHRKDRMTAGQIRSSKGDIVPPDHWTHFNAECKSYADFTWHQLFTDGGCSQLEDWLAQLMTVSDSGDLNILFFKITRRGQYVVVQNIDWNTDCSHVRYASRCGEWLVYDFNRFFELNADLVRRRSVEE